MAHSKAHRDKIRASMLAYHAGRSRTTTSKPLKPRMRSASHIDRPISPTSGAVLPKRVGAGATPAHSKSKTAHKALVTRLAKTAQRGTGMVKTTEYNRASRAAHRTGGATRLGR